MPALLHVRPGSGRDEPKGPRSTWVRSGVESVGVRHNGSRIVGTRLDSDHSLQPGVLANSFTRVLLGPAGLRAGMVGNQRCGSNPTLYYATLYYATLRVILCAYLFSLCLQFKSTTKPESPFISGLKCWGDSPLDHHQTCCQTTIIKCVTKSYFRWPSSEKPGPLL
jgi:hypothetical protein